ncbi:MULTISPECIES: trypsin-like serine protease [Streptomyces]|jgi:streptogrisin C|uniref:Streptogrisin C n=2 Tax=Streptomyces TaxID=1883 RepID=A0AA40SK29_9ACTN|nr:MULTISPECIES: trypsin-like serine protease [Streptomyces]MBA8947966.1 streptogrisin C [Streptomyces calvus]MBA8976498.1 streptogrisin C [Streptomyces calvus]MYS25481.1 trypsin-like serine protease [Streptomyces sp. SID7804]GGP82327.1 serine protease [Streptomyces calvus]
MLHRHARTARRSALTALGALVLAGLPAAASADPAPAAGPAPSAAQTLGADRPSPHLLGALQRDLGLNAQQASERLVNEAEAGTRAGRLRNALGERFAGAWVRGETSKELTVATTDTKDVAAIEAQGARATVVERTLADLRAAKQKLDAAAGRVGTLETPVWYIDVPKNRIMVQATSQAAGTAFVEAAGLAGEDIGISMTTLRPRLLQDITGGDAFYIDGSARCSVGFSVTKGEQAGFVTAGHCGRRGATTTGYDRTAQGTFQASTFPAKDMAWVATNDQWTPTPDVKAQDGQEVQVTGSAQALVGASVCRSGSTTGWRCGTVEQHDATVSYPEGRVDGLTRTTVCAEPGDSGGPFVAGAQAQGVTSGGSGDCTSGGTTYYQPVNPMLADFGLTLTTATAQTTPEQQEDGAQAWTAGRVYEAGTTVTRDGVRYQCLQTHQAQGAWAPAGTPALWQRL